MLTFLTFGNETLMVWWSAPAAIPQVMQVAYLIIMQDQSQILIGVRTAPAQI